VADFLSTLGEGLAAIAPSIASAFGGPLAGLGVTWLERALGVAPGSAASDPKGFQVALQSAMATPDQVLALKKADDEFKEFCATNALELVKADNADRASARERQAAMRDAFPNQVAALILAAFGIAIAFQCALIVLVPLYHLAVPTELYRVLDAATGSLTTLAVTVATYYFGSSAGSRAKDDALAAAARP
jgi:hypothetical protein